MGRRLTHPLGGFPVRKKMAVAVALLALSTAACKKTGDGEYEVQKPVIGTVTDTVRAPLEMGKDTVTVVTPKVEIRKDSTKVTVPTVKKRP